METKKILMALAVFLVAGLVFAGVVTYLSNTVTVGVTAKSPIELSTTAIDGAGNPVADLTNVDIVGGDTITLNLTANNISHVTQNGKYTLVITPNLETDDVSIDATTITSGDVGTVDLTSTSIIAGASESKTVTITVDSTATPQAYSIALTYNAP